MGCTKWDVKDGILGFVIAAMVCTIIINLSTIIASPILYNTEYCGSKNEYQTHLAMIWSICQSIPLLIVFPVLLTIERWGNYVTSFFIPRIDGWVGVHNFVEMKKTRELIQLKNLYVVEKTQLWEHRPGAGPGGAAYDVLVGSVTLNKAWKSPRSTRCIKIVQEEEDAKGKSTTQYLLEKEPGDDAEYGDGLIWDKKWSTCSLIRDEAAEWRALHRKYYWSSRYSLIPAGHSSLWYALKDIFMDMSIISGLALTAIHIALGIWGCVLFGLHWGKDLCSESVHLERFLMFTLTYNWFIEVSFGILFVIYHTI